MTYDDPVDLIVSTLEEDPEARVCFVLPGSAGRIMTLRAIAFRLGDAVDTMWAGGFNVKREAGTMKDASVIALAPAQYALSARYDLLVLMWMPAAEFLRAYTGRVAVGGRVALGPPARTKGEVKSVAEFRAEFPASFPW